MGIFSTVKKASGRMFDVRVDKWIGWEYIVDNTNEYKTIIKDMATADKATHPETYEEALKRLNLTEADIEQRKIEFTRLFIFFIGLALAIIGYGLYMAVQGNLIPAIIAFCISLYSLSQAFRFHFWLFQIKYKKLGCTFKEWLNGKPLAPLPMTKKKSTPAPKPRNEDQDPS